MTIELSTPYPEIDKRRFIKVVFSTLELKKTIDHPVMLLWVTDFISQKYTGGDFYYDGSIISIGRYTPKGFPMYFDKKQYMATLSNIVTKCNSICLPK